MAKSKNTVKKTAKKVAKQKTSIPLAKSAPKKAARAKAKPAKARPAKRRPAKAKPKSALRARAGAAKSGARPAPKVPPRKARPAMPVSPPRAPAPARAVPGVRTGPPKPPPAPGQPELNVGDDAVHKATGRTWAQWFKALDTAGARTLAHSDIARLVFQRFRVNPWWSQMVTVGYEQARGLREKHEKAEGYSISASKTLAAPAERVYAAWNVDAERGRWLGMNLKVRSAAPPKSIRLNWSDQLSQIVVMLQPRGAGKTQVAVEHNKLKDRAECARMKTFWASALERLGAAVGGR
jgi:uncharacterized protein YndB with AHSA1/START domain